MALCIKNVLNINCSQTVNNCCSSCTAIRVVWNDKKGYWYGIIAASVIYFGKKGIKRRNEYIFMNKTLWDLNQGDNCVVSNFGDELEEHYGVRLMELGFHPGEVVSCELSPSLGAPKLYRVNNTIYSLDDQIARLVKIKKSS